MSYQSKVPGQLASMMALILAKEVPDKHCTLSSSLGLRASGLPFCPLKFFLGIPKQFRSKHVEVGSSFFFRVGTTVHEVLQKGVEHSIEELTKEAGMVPVADWKCLSCGHVHVFVPRPECCEFCGDHHYEMMEHTVQYRQLTGHIDNVFYLPRLKKYLIIDYKTATLKKVEAKGPAVFGNKQQIGTYVAIKHSEGYDMLGWALLYVARNSPWQWYPVVDEAPNNEAFLKRLNKYCDQHEYLMTVTELGKKEVEWLWNNRMCKTPEQIKDRADYCPFKDMCSGPKRSMDLHIEQVVKFVEKKLPLSQFLELDHKVGYRDLK